RARVTTRANEMVPVPVDADAGIGKTFITTVERDVVIDLALVRLSKLPGAAHRSFLFDSKYKNQIAFGLNFARVQRPDGRQQSFDIARVVANARSKDSAVVNSC